MDKVLLKGMRLFGFHGVYPSEKELGQIFEVDAELYFSFRDAVASDDIKDTVDYSRVCQVIAEVFGIPCNLLETVAAKLAEEILRQFPVEKVVIRVRKAHPPVGCEIDFAEVEVSRSKF